MQSSTSLLQQRPRLMMLPQPPHLMPPLNKKKPKKTNDCYCSKKSLITFSVIVFVIVTIAFTVSFIIYAVNLFSNHSTVVNDIKDGILVIIETADEVVGLIQEADESAKLVNVLIGDIRVAAKTGQQLGDDFNIF